MSHEESTRQQLIDQITGLTEPEYKELLLRIVEDPAQRSKIEDRLGFIEFVDTHKLWQAVGDCLERFRMILGGNEAKPESPAEPLGERDASELEFVNREAELRDLLDENGPRYRLVSVPVGYGKTALLRELEKRYRGLNWHCAYVNIEDTTTIPQLAIELANRLLDQSASLDVTSTPEDLGRQLASLVETYVDFERRVDGHIIRNKGLVLLMDINRPMLGTHGRPPIDPKALVPEFIGGFESGLRLLPVFRDSRCQFRVVIAGRNLNEWWKSQMGALELVPYPLSPFTFEVVFRSVDNLWPGRAREDNERLAAFLMYHTGGHPGCVIEVLKCFQQAHSPPIEKFFAQPSDKQTWYRPIINVIEAIHNGLPENLRDILHVVSVFRVLDYRILDTLMGKPDTGIPISTVGSPPIVWYGRDLADVLVDTQLLYWDEVNSDLLMSDIVRRLLVLHWLQHDPDRFTTLCQQASAIYEKMILDSEDGRAIWWAIEMMFQRLQQYYPHAQTAAGRAQARQEFLGEHLPRCLDTLFKGRHKDRVGKMLMRRLKGEWELLFMIRFLMRREEFGFDDEPAQAFLASVECIQGR